MRHIILQSPKPAPAVAPPPDLSAQAATGLTAASSDDELLAVLRADESVLNRVQHAAQAAYEAAVMLPSGPVQAVQHRWQEAQRASLTVLQQAGGRNVIGSRRAEDWTARVKLLRIAMGTGDHFRDLVSRWAVMKGDERAAMVLQSVAEATGRAAQVAPAGVNATEAARPYNAQPLLTGLMQRGVHLWASEGGTILARPANFLTPQDRAEIRAHKAAILTALADEVAVA